MVWGRAWYFEIQKWVTTGFHNCTGYKNRFVQTWWASTDCLGGPRLATLNFLGSIKCLDRSSLLKRFITLQLTLSTSSVKGCAKVYSGTNFQGIRIMSHILTLNERLKTKSKFVMSHYTRYYTGVHQFQCGSECGIQHYDLVLSSSIRLKV